MVAAGISGAENHLLRLLPNLNREKYDIHLLVMSPSIQVYHDFNGKGEGLNVIFVPLGGKANPLNFIRLFKLFRKEKYDLLHTHNSRADVYGILSGKMAGIRILMASIHGYQDYDRINPMFKLRGFILRKFANRIITISNALKDLISKNEQIDKGKMDTVYYGLDFLAMGGERKDIRKEFAIDKDSSLLVDVGRLIPVKGHEYLIHSLKNVVSLFPKTKLFIVGEGILEESLKDLTKRLGLENHILFTGHRRDVPDFMNEADLFVFPTLGEGFGLVLLEAMAFKKPIVATRVMSIPEIVEDGKSGLLVPPRNPEALAEAIVQLLKDKDRSKEFGKRGHEILLSKFSTERMVEETERIYDRLFAG